MWAENKSATIRHAFVKSLLLKSIAAVTAPTLPKITRSRSSVTVNIRRARWIECRVTAIGECKSAEPAIDGQRDGIKSWSR